MTRETPGPDAPPCIGLDLGYPIVDQPSGSQLQTNPSKERIRQRAHEIGRGRAAQAILRSTGTERSMSWLQHSGGNPSRRKKIHRPARPLQEWRRSATRRCHGATR
jgi:hypothetical protein